MSKSYSEEREEIQNSIKKYRGDLNKQVKSSANIFKNSGKNILLGVTVISVAIVIGGWASRPKNNYQQVEEQEENVESSNEAVKTKTVRVVQKDNSFLTIIKNELASFLVTLLKDNISSLMQELPHILASKTHEEAKTKSKD